MTNPQQNFGNQQVTQRAAGASSPPSDRARSGQPGESADAVFTPEQALGIFNRGMEDYWNRRGFTMPSQPQPPSQPSAPQALAPAPPVGAPYYSQVRGEPLHERGLPRSPRPSDEQAHSSSLAPYHLLPQQGYVAKRRYQPQAPIVFRTTTTGYLTLLDAMNGQLASLIDGDATVFTDDNLSQKQSIRLEVSQ